MLGSSDASDNGARFRRLALPHLNALYMLARYLTRNADDADDAVQECYLRALRHFDGFRGTEIKPWLLAILRNVCHAQYGRRAELPTSEMESDAFENVIPLWQEEQQSPEVG